MGLFTNGAFGIEVPCVAIPLLVGRRYVNMNNICSTMLDFGWDIMSAIGMMIDTRLPWEH